VRDGLRSLDPGASKPRKLAGKAAAHGPTLSFPQDCLYGISKALELGLLDLSSFDPEEYCFYEQVQNGDFNWVSKDFIAFASPTDNAYVRALNTGQLAAYERETMGRKRSRGYANVLRYFEENRVRLVVRLNNPLYDRRDFERRGIEFKDMFFEDGTNVGPLRARSRFLPSLALTPSLFPSDRPQPPPEMVREFLRDADRIIDDNGVIAIHCKAGLGRTGCLIAAHLVYKYGFTAGEVIGFMRICRVRPPSYVVPFLRVIG
jgi:cell division cycle 14